MKSLAGRVFSATGATWLVLPLAVTILCVVMVGTSLAGWRYHGSAVYGHPRAYISTYVPAGS